MKKVHWLLVCLFIGNLVTAQSSSTCDSDENTVTEEDLNSIDKCKVISKKLDKDGKPIRQIILSFNASQGRRFLRKRKAEKKAIQKAKEAVRAITELDTKGVKTNAKGGSNAEKKLTINKINRKSAYLLHEVDYVPVFEACKVFKDIKILKCFKSVIGKHIQKNFEYPEEAIEENITGKVSVQFLFDKYGKIQIKKIIDNNEEKILGKYTAELISKLPKFTPARRNGKHVPLSYELSLDFSL